MNELKRELSKLTGIDFFNPKFREVFKKHFPNERDAEEEKVDEILDDNKDEKVDDVEAEDFVEDMKDINTKEADEKAEDKVEDIDKAEDEREIDKIEEEKADNDEKADEKAEEVNEESHEIGKDVDELDDSKKALLDAKIELELIKNGVSSERLESAKRMAKYEVTSLDELDKVKDLIREYPEWVRTHKVKDFGMPVDENPDELTEEEKKLKQMGIDPRD